MRRIVAPALAAVVAIVAAPARAATPVETHGALSIKGTQLVDKSGQAIQLAGMSLYWSGWAGGAFFNGRAVRWLASDWKSSIVRAAMGVEGGGNYLTNPAVNEAYVDSVVQAAIDAGIYVIIDWHDHHADVNVDSSKAFFTRMATKWGQYPNVMYEIFNEPLGADNLAVPPRKALDWPTIKAYSTAMVETIRAVDPDNLILIPTPSWDQSVGMAAASPLTGPKMTNLIYVLHFYAGTHGATLRDAADAALTKIPLIISEWGTTNADGGGGADKDIYYLETADWLDWAVQKKISWCNWSLVNLTETSAALRGDVERDSVRYGWWDSTEISESGLFVRDEIRRVTQGYNYTFLDPIPPPPPPKPDTSALPGRIEAESYIAQAKIQSEVTSDPLGGGRNIGYIEHLDWAEYAVNVESAGSYFAHARIASAYAGGTLRILVGGQVADTISVPGTKGWQNWITVSSARPIAFAAGLTKVRLQFVYDPAKSPDSLKSLYNLNWVDFNASPDAIRGGAERPAARLLPVRSGLLDLSALEDTWRTATVYDLAGRRLAATALPAQALALPAAAKGLLVVRLEGSSGVETRSIFRAP